MGDKIPLGGQSTEGVVMTTEASLDKVKLLEQRLNELAAIINQTNLVRLKEKRGSRRMEALQEGLNKDGIPVGITLVGHSSKYGTRFVLTLEDGYFLAGQKYDSLSAVAEAASGVRRSGWTFWRTASGKTVKEEYGKP